MIKLVSGFSGPGGSTIAHMSLVNLFNEAGMEACFYGPSYWDGIDCRFDTHSAFKSHPDDIIIFHYMQLPKGLVGKKKILSCHETVVMPLKQLGDKLEYDAVHFVSQGQKEWQGVDGTVIPNVLRKFTSRDKTGLKVAGIIGSIDPNKRIHESITRAKNDGFKRIKIYGNLTDYNYFFKEVLPLLSEDVTYHGVAKDMDFVYSTLSHVYHSPILETYNLVKPECAAAGVIYMGDEGNDTKAEVWSNEKILDAWKKLLI